jgi:formylglycine-generating enzyme required for sulfatase activity
MAGNVSEWTASRFEPYPYDPSGGREDPEGEAERVTRGGSWHSPPLRVRTVSRGMNDPFFTDRDLGFRCACAP